VLALVVAGFLAFGGDDEGDVSADGGSRSERSSTTEETTTTELREATRGDGLDPELDSDGVLIDDFEREGPDLGDFPGGARWEVLAGEWSIADGRIGGAGSEDEAGNLTVFDPGAGDVRAQVEITRRANGAGIAFRVEDEDNYYAWATAPDYGTLVLIQVADGERTVLLDAGLASTGDGMPALGINLTGTKVELLFDGAVTETYDELPPAEGRERIGLTVARVDQIATFDDFRVLTAG